MKPEEAIKALENIAEYWTYRPTEVEATKLAIDALNKQIPKKATNIEDNFFPETYDYYYSSAKCPNCGREFTFVEYTEPHYCEECGQAIDWSNWGDE